MSSTPLETTGGVTASTTPSQDQAQQPKPDDRPCSPYVDILTLARESATKVSFMRKVLRQVTRYFASPYAAVNIRYASEAFQDDFHVGPTDPNFWKTSLQAFLTDSLGVRQAKSKVLRAKSGDTKVAFISAPVFDDAGATLGSLALVVAPVTETELPRRMATLEALVGLASACAAHLGEWTRSTEKPDGVVGATASRASAAALARAADSSSDRELAFSITNELRNKFGLEQVSLGWVEGRRIRILSISGLEEVNKRSPGVQNLTAAMEECLDVGVPIAFQQSTNIEEGELQSRYRLHKLWHAAVKGNAVASIPLRSGERTIAILSLCNGADRPFDREQLEGIGARVEPYAQALRMARRAGRSLPRHASDAARSTGREILAPGHLGRKILLGLCSLASLWFVFGSLSYEPTVPCVVQPAQVRHLAAPFVGVLSAVYANEGDRVNSGDVLCALERRALDQEVAKLDAELLVLEYEKNAAMGAGNRVEVRLAEAKLQLVTAKLNIAQDRVDRTVIRAPFDGVVMVGDLRKRVGGSLAQGDPLFQVAPTDRWRLELEVPQDKTADLAVGLRGRFAAYANPEQSSPINITRVLGSAQDRGGRNSFIAEAEFSARSDWLRPGMEGVAKIEYGSRPVWWVSLHGMIDYLRMAFWL
jgi:biotin carboxyl carrier protein